MWTYWLTDQFTISLLHLDTIHRILTLCVPNVGNVDSCVKNRLITDINQLVKHSLINSEYEDCKTKDACQKDFNLDSPLHTCNYMFYLSLRMVNDDVFTSNKFKNLMSSINEYDPTLHRKGIVDMVCSTIINNFPDNGNQFVMNGNGITLISEVFNKCCDQIDSELGKHVLVGKFMW